MEKKKNRFERERIWDQWFEREKERERERERPSLFEREAESDWRERLNF